MRAKSPDRLRYHSSGSEFEQDIRANYNQTLSRNITDKQFKNMVNPTTVPTEFTEIYHVENDLKQIVQSLLE